jgi:hypothetical protein
MTKQKGYARISITLPHETLAEADRMAASFSRSRSWIIAEGVRRLAEAHRDRPNARAEPMVSEVPAPGFEIADSRHGDQRFLQLRSDLQLSAEERVRVSEEVARLDTLLRPGHGDQFLAFTRYQDYLAWDHRSRIRR